MRIGGYLLVSVLAAGLVDGFASAQHRDSAARLPRLEVAANDRFLVHEGGAPFFWLGDTAWAIFEKAVREAAGRLGSGEKLIFGADVPWAEALDAPGRWST